MPRPFVFGVDLDGVVADYTLGFREVVAADRGVAPDSLPLARSWDFHEWDLSVEDFNRLHQYAVNELRMLASLPAIEGAADALWRLSDAGVWIRVVTHRLYTNWGHAAAIADTVTWLDQHRIPYRDICFLGAKPEIEADCYIDDAPHNIVGLREEGNTVIVFDQPYNRDFDGLRARTWPEVEEIIVDLAARKAGALEVQLPGLGGEADRLARRVSDS
ncbi:MAG: putative 5'(3')-deoxyribonucleotidase [Acidimicrobiales bacterium]|nr:MAG: putative 5'(3')-deoxyribonucleotidase [Acidimicrobiales bacterium]